MHICWMPSSGASSANALPLANKLAAMRTALIAAPVRIVALWTHPCERMQLE